MVFLLKTKKELKKLCKQEIRPKGSGIKSMSDQQLVDGLNEPIIREFKSRKIYFSFKDNIWGADLADMQSICIYNKEIRFFLSVIDVFSNTFSGSF